MFDEKNYSPFYKRYLELCNEHGYSVHGAAKAAGISSGSPTAWKGGAIPRLDQRQRLCALFGVTDNDLLGYEKPIPTGDGLSELERDLIEGFRQLNQQGKEYVMQSLYVARQAYSQGDNGISKVENAG